MSTGTHLPWAHPLLFHPPLEQLTVQSLGDLVHTTFLLQGACCAVCHPCCVLMRCFSGIRKCSNEQQAPAEAPAPVLATATATALTAATAAAPVPGEKAENPIQYPSEHLIQSTSEENQIPSHLPVCPALQHIASLSGRAVIELFHSSIAEVMPRGVCLALGKGVHAVGVLVSPEVSRVCPSGNHSRQRGLSFLLCGLQPQGRHPCRFPSSHSPSRSW